MAIGASQSAAERMSVFGRGLVPNSTNIKGGYVVVHVSTTDDKLVDLPNAAGALLNGRAYTGVSACEGQVASTDNQILVSRLGVEKCALKVNTACTAGDVAAYDPADGGVVVPYTSKTQVVIGKFIQTKLASASEQLVGVFLMEGVNSKADTLLGINASNSTAITNTTTETAFDRTISIPANSLSAGSILRIHSKINVTSGNATDTLTLKVRLNSAAGVVLGVGPTVDVTNGGGDIGAVDLVALIKTIGAGGTMSSGGFIGISPGGATAATGNVLATGTAGTVAIDTTVANTIVVTATWSVASLSNSCRLEDLIVTII